jgi:hypothetical protein
MKMPLFVSSAAISSARFDRTAKHIKRVEMNGKFRRKKMSKICRICESTEPQPIAKARALGLEQEFQGGMYTCCQIAKWADEQSLAWLEAAREDATAAHNLTKQPESPQTEAALVPLRFRRQQIRWFGGGN